MNDKIIIQGARENNLKNVNLTIPRDKLVVFTGLSGSGKSSLAFDTIYAEGQRRYVESLSSYARQFLGQMDKPDVDSIDGLSPAISIDQKTTSKNPRSTVGTVTEIYDYLRLLWARVGVPHCPKCGREIRRQTIDQIVDRVEALGEGTRFIVLSPVIRGKKGEHKKVFEDARKSGFARVRLLACRIPRELRFRQSAAPGIQNLQLLRVEAGQPADRAVRVRGQQDLRRDLVISIRLFIDCRRAILRKRRDNGVLRHIKADSVSVLRPDRDGIRQHVVHGLPRRLHCTPA